MTEKFTEEMKDEIVKYILETGKSYREVGEEFGIGKNAVYNMVKAYKKKNGIVGTIRKKEPRQTEEELRERIRELERSNREKDREIARQEKMLSEEREKVEILKQSLHIFMEHRK